MAAAHQSSVRREVRETITAVEIRRPPPAPKAPPPPPRKPPREDEVTLSGGAADLKTALVRQLFERLTGRKMEAGELEKMLDDLRRGQATLDLGGAPPAETWTAFRIERVERLEESETTAFSARATITTTDGRTLEVGVDLALSRRFLDERRIELTAASGTTAAGNGARTKDPLVLSFAAPAATLRADTTAFDLDADGQADDIHFVAPGSGFVALDRNGNDTIDDGGELFGARTGDGFAELAAYDDDGNGWIDEADAVYDDLRIWSQDAAGNDRLAGLKAHGVGAIYLGRVAAAHSYRDAQNAAVAEMRSAGFYVGEVGHRAGAVQQIDLVV